MAKFDVKLEAEKFISDLKTSKCKMETSKNFELDYMRQYAQSDFLFVMSILKREYIKKNS